jgi:hypothetical protein
MAPDTLGSFVVDMAAIVRESVGLRIKPFECGMAKNPLKGLAILRPSIPNQREYPDLNTEIVRRIYCITDSLRIAIQSSSSRELETFFGHLPVIPMAPQYCGWSLPHIIVTEKKLKLYPASYGYYCWVFCTLSAVITT